MFSQNGNTYILSHFLAGGKYSITLSKTQMLYSLHAATICAYTRHEMCCMCKCTAITLHPHSIMCYPGHNISKIHRHQKSCLFWKRYQSKFLVLRILAGLRLPWPYPQPIQAYDHYQPVWVVWTNHYKIQFLAIAMKRSNLNMLNQIYVKRIIQSNASTGSGLVQVN